MKGVPEFSSIRSRLGFWFFMVTLLLLTVTTLIEYRLQVSAIKQTASEKLTAIRDLKIGQINAWVLERRRDLHTLAQDFDADYTPGQTALPHAKEPGAGARQLRKRFERYLEAYAAYDEIFFIDAHSRRIVISTDRLAEGTLIADLPYFTEPLLRHDIYVDDIRPAKPSMQPTLILSVAIWTDAAPPSMLGVLALRINLADSLYPILRDRTGMGTSGESLIVDERGMALSELLWRPQAPLRLTLDAQPAQLAAHGAAGAIEALDYAGRPVLAAFSYLPEMR